MISLGWTDHFAALAEDVDPARLRITRIISQGQGHYHLALSPNDSIEGAISAKFHKSIRSTIDYPTVGDWVTFALAEGQRQATIHRVLERSNCLQRRRAGGGRDMQLLAANVDSVFIVTSANEDFDLPRIGRYVAIANEADRRPTVLLTKVDLCDDPGAFRKRLEAEFENIEVLLISREDPRSLAPLERFAGPGQTVVLLGSSGVGKSTLTNYLTGEEVEKTQAVGADSRGRHTTTARTLRFTRWGGMVIDTPGMQDVTGVEDEDVADEGFADLDELVLNCKFTTCRHQDERGCAVRAEIVAGALSAERWASYLTRATRAPKKRFKPRGR